MPSQDEVIRSRALHSYAILDTPKEEEFDDLARIAAEVCGTPMAVVNLVDTDRQFFKAEVGLGVRETPLGTSFCGHAILAEELMIVEDAALDCRFVGNPLVHGASGLRFYAGILLRTPDGHAIGTICVLDTVPRQLDASQIRTLKLLARQAMTQLELRKAVAERERALAVQRSEMNRSRQIFDSTVDFGIIVTDGEGRVTDWSRGAQRVFGWTQEEIVGRPVSILFTPEDRAQGVVGSEMAIALEDGRAIDERWHLHKTGSRFWASGETTPLRSQDGAHLGFVRVLRDRTAGHLAGERLRLVERRLRQAQEAGGVGVFTVDVAAGTLEPTPEFSRLFGLDHRERRPALDFENTVVAEDQELVSHNSTRKVGASPKDVEYRIRRPSDGALRWISRKGEFERDETGTPLRFIGVALDITDRVEAQARLSDSERKWRGLFEQLQEGFILASVVRDAAGHIVDWRCEEVNQAFGRQMGIDPREAMGRTICELLPSIEDDWVRAFGAVVETQRPLRFTRQVGRHDRWYDGVAQPLGADRFSVIFLDVTDRIRREAEFRDSEARLRTVVESMPVGVLLAEAPSGTIVIGNRRMDELIGRDDDTQALDDTYASLTALDAEGSLVDPGRLPLQRIIRGEAEAATIEVQLERSNGERRWIEIVGEAIRSDAGVLAGAVVAVTDIERRKQDEARQWILNRELSHRLKNTLAIVQSIASQTLRRAPDKDSARKSLTARIQALANAHDILLKGASDAGSIEEIVRACVSVHDEGGRIDIRGPEIMVGPKAALTLALLCHELATNAAKYGALSVPHGTVSLVWTLRRDAANGKTMLAFDWVERNGPAVEPPASTGFGTRLIQTGLTGTAQGSVAMIYDREGLRCAIVAPLAELVETDDGKTETEPP